MLQVGFTFFKDAVGKIKHPQEIEFNLVSVIVLLLSIGIKLWLGMFNKKLGTRIHSNVMLATAADAMGDVITTSATVVSLLVFQFSGWNIDGIVGIGVSLVVMWAGVGIAKDTLEPLLGQAVPKDVYEEITKSATVVSLLVFQFSGWNVDGIVGIGVSLVVMWAGEVS